MYVGIMELVFFLQSHNIPFYRDVSLSSKTWIHTGGNCSFWITPISIVQLKELCCFLYSECIDFDIVGQTSNIFFHSTYNPQVVVSTVKVTKYEICSDTIACECGVSVIKLAKDCLLKGFLGFYGLVGLPGTVGAATVNNSGCFNCSISSMLISAEVLLPDGAIQIMQKEDFIYRHRSSAFKRGEKKGIILSVKLKAEKALNIEEEYRKAEETKIYRKKKQEGPNRNLGSVFSTRKRKLNFKNQIAAIFTKITKLFCISDPKRTYKQLLLWLYGYSVLSRYISDKNINTFIWKDSEAEIYFEKYKEFMGKVYNNPTMEVEERK